MESSASIGYGLSCSSISISEVKSDQGQESGKFRGQSVSAGEVVRCTESSVQSEPKKAIGDRITHPFYAIKNRFTTFVFCGCFLGGLVGYSVLPVLGAAAGGIAGGIVKLAKMVGGHESNALKIGMVIGHITGILITMPVAVVLSAVGVVAGAVIATVGSVVALPFDIYRAATLDKSELHSWVVDLDFLVHLLPELMDSVVVATINKELKELGIKPVRKPRARRLPVDNGCD